MLSHGSRRLRGRGAATAAEPASVTMSSGSLALLTQLTARKLVPGRHRGLEQRRRLSLTVALRPCARYVQPSRKVPDNRGIASVLPRTRWATAPVKLLGSCTREDRLDRTRPSQGPAAAGFGGGVRAGQGAVSRRGWPSLVPGGRPGGAGLRPRAGEPGSPRPYGNRSAQGAPASRTPGP